MSLKQAQAELDAIAARLHREGAASDLGFGVYLQTLNDAFTSNVRPALLMLMCCVGFVLLIACSNVANLLLAGEPRGVVKWHSGLHWARAPKMSYI